jgi:hypothetical protein
MSSKIEAVGRRNRQREKLAAPVSEYRDGDANLLSLRGSLTPATRRQYTETFAGGLDREDAWQRAGEYLFERLAIAWTVSGIEYRGQNELLARYRMAGPDERQFVRRSLREHLQENFPELPAP